MQRRDRLVGFGVHMLELIPVPLNHRVNVVALVVRHRLQLLFFVDRGLLRDSAHPLPPNSFLLNFGKIGVATHEIVHVHNLGLVQVNAVKVHELFIRAVDQAHRRRLLKLGFKHNDMIAGVVVTVEAALTVKETNISEANHRTQVHLQTLLEHLFAHALADFSDLAL